MQVRSEYPRPQFERSDWLCLNGEWEFEIDSGDSGRQRGLIEKPELDGKIIVPFCPESRLSGVQNVDFMQAVWYKRTFILPEKAAGKRVFINLDAVDYECEVWINGHSVGTHKGGYVGFSFEISAFVQRGENTVVICARDDTRSGRQPGGKQSHRYLSHGCHYTRTTGIWQSVWLEWTDETRIKSVRITPDGVNGSVLVEAEIDGCCTNLTLSAQAAFEGEYEGEAEVDADAGQASVTLLIEEPKLWMPGEGNLYDLILTLKKGGKPVDKVKSYFGLRSISFSGKKCLINGEPVFQRLVLDQGFYPDGIYTAPSDEELKNDILRSMAMGFNGARLHQKVFEPRFLYWADKLGYIVWGEMASWGIDPADKDTLAIFTEEWLQVLARDYNHPSIVGWCPWNETWGESNKGTRESTMRLTYLVTKSYDRTRPCIDASGGMHALTDIYDTHDYCQDAKLYAERYAPGQPMYGTDKLGPYREGQPVFVSEYGGIGWNPDGEGWGYGNGPKTEEEFLERLKGLTDALMDNPEHMGFCYTQLTDVEQERNGLYYYDRAPKFPPEKIRPIFARKAAIEQ
ncbi:MAG: beta-galactosidase [Clostridia bacterium]|nr:beta-galactosidase [Clostridia bacterium]